jgi:hypothetical protein
MEDLVSKGEKKIFAVLPGLITLSPPPIQFNGKWDYVTIRVKLPIFQEFSASH